MYKYKSPVPDFIMPPLKGEDDLAAGAFLYLLMFGHTVKRLGLDFDEDVDGLIRKLNSETKAPGAHGAMLADRDQTSVAQVGQSEADVERASASEPSK